VANKTIQRGTGARGLRAVLEEVMLDIMFNLPSRDDVREVVITLETIEEGSEPLLILEPETQRREA
jgi:ATP-dependent Clp protease ATP-binding subunit ClpX